MLGLLYVYFGFLLFSIMLATCKMQKKITTSTVVASLLDQGKVRLGSIETEPTTRFYLVKALPHFLSRVEILTTLYAKPVSMNAE